MLSPFQRGLLMGAALIAVSVFIAYRLLPDPRPTPAVPAPPATSAPIPRAELYPIPPSASQVYGIVEDGQGRRTPPFTEPQFLNEDRLLEIARGWQCPCGAPPAGIEWRMSGADPVLRPARITLWCRRGHPLTRLQSINPVLPQAH